MFGDKALHGVTHADLMAFLSESREEGVRLDYKMEWTPNIVGTACAFANTYGGYILYGIKELELKNRPNQPDPSDVPGVDFSKGDPAASLRSRILDNTRPPVPIEIKAVPLPGSENRSVLIVYIEESPDAPHEVLINSATRIPVRRADTTVAASLDEIERLITQRDRYLQAGKKSLDLDFFEGSLAGPSNFYGERNQPPTVAVAVRPRRVNSLHFAFDDRFDRKLKDLALRSAVADNLEHKATPSGLILQDGPDLPVTTRLEVSKDGTIRGGRALTQTSTGSAPLVHGEWGQTQSESTLKQWLDFGELVSSVIAMIRFCAMAFSTRRPALELEMRFGLADCQGHFTQILDAGRSRSHTGQIPQSPFYQQPIIEGAVIRTRSKDAGPNEEDLLRLTREISRLFSISAPDELLKRYVE